MQEWVSSTPPAWKEISFPLPQMDFKLYEMPCTMSDAMFAARRLHLFVRLADRVKQASLLYPTNTWQALMKTDGPRFFLSPTYHVFDMLKGHMGA